MLPPLTPVVKILLILNIGIYFCGYLFNLDFASMFGLRIFSSPAFNPIQIVTHVFLHGGFGHLFSNMFALYMFGPMVEQALGQSRFIVFYAVCALGAAGLYTAVAYWELHQLQNAVELYLANQTPDGFVQFIADQLPQAKSQMIAFINQFSENPNNPLYLNEAAEFVKMLELKQLNMPMVGASGAIFGILLGFGYLFPNVRLMLLFPPIPIQAKYFIGFYAIVELFAGVRPTQGDNVAHFAHIGGMLFAFILLRAWNFNRNTFS